MPGVIVAAILPDKLNEVSDLTQSLTHLLSVLSLTMTVKATTTASIYYVRSLLKFESTYVMIQNNQHHTHGAEYSCNFLSAVLVV